MIGIASKCERGRLGCNGADRPVAVLYDGHRVLRRAFRKMLNQRLDEAVRKFGEKMSTDRAPAPGRTSRVHGRLPYNVRHWTELVIERISHAP